MPESKDLRTFTNERLQTSFAVPERPTVRQQLRHNSEVAFLSHSEFYERAWAAARTLIVPESWQSPHLALDADLDAITSTQATAVIRWAANEVSGHVLALEETAPNS